MIHAELDIWLKDRNGFVPDAHSKVMRVETAPEGAIRLSTRTHDGVIALVVEADELKEAIDRIYEVCQWNENST